MIKMSQLQKYVVYGVVANGLVSVAKYMWNKYNSQATVAASSNPEALPEIENEVPPQEFTTVSRFGLITNLYNGYGLIDKEIYFDSDVFVGSERPREGLQVRAQVRVFKNGSQSVADHVEAMHECWEVDAPDVAQPQLIEPTQISTVGKITEIVEPNICWIKEINGDICIDLNETSIDDSRPVVGDWVTLTRLQDDDDESSNASQSRPFKYQLNVLRKKDFCGKVSKVDDKVAVVDDNLFIIRGSGCFDSNTVFCVGDEIRGTATESSFEDFEWRVTRVENHIKISDRIYQRHLNERVKSISQLVVDKEGMSITSPIDFGEVVVGETYSEKVHVRNDGNRVQPIPHCYFKNGCENQLECVGKIQNTFNGRKRSINPGEEAAFTLKCSPKSLGRHQGVINFDFNSFEIARTVTFQARDKRQQLLLQNGKRNGFCHKNRERQSPARMHNDGGSSVFIPGRGPEAGPRMRMPVYILNHPVPKQLWECHDDEEALLRWQPKLQSELTWKNYKDNFSTLLHLEEIQQTIDMAQFNMERVFLKEEEHFLLLEVPGLAEGRPSIMIRDSIIVTDPDDSSLPSYGAVVHVIRHSEVLIKFDESYHQRFVINKAVNVKFVLKRTTFKRCHQAVQLFHRIGSEVLFPIKAKPKFPVIKFRSANIINKQLNERQLSAVRSILEARQRPAPYIIYGPPGTGKTVTVIETILQVFHLRPDSRILVCAPSNSAADLLCERLHLSGCVTTADLVRLNAPQRRKELPSMVEQYSHSYLGMEIVYRYRIIVCTCVTASLLYQMGISPGHFTHVFIDEAGQATECELMIPVSVAAAKDITNFQLILAGDPQQLGPIIRSKMAGTYGLQTSFLERLCNNCEPYLRDELELGGYNPDFVTKLVENYRSHPSLIQLSSKLFYGSELIPKASARLTHSFRDWPQLLNPDVMILFHGIRSEELQEYDSPSWFNPEEIMQVILYLNNIYEFGAGPEDVGIITPYRRQVEKMKVMLSTLDVPCPKVGSVEEFQGQERSAIIVSTVRSTNDCLFIHQQPNNNSLGFLCNPKRFNVTLTRAHALLIVVGNPFLLVKDFYWRQFLAYCLEREVYTGVDRDELVELITAMESGVH